MTMHMEDVMGVSPARADGWDTVGSEKHRAGVPLKTPSNSTVRPVSRTVTPNP